MTMPHQTWPTAMAVHVGIWMAMMVPMMLPSLIPTLSWYRRSVRGAHETSLDGLTALVVMGYLAVWAAIGLAVSAAGAGVMAAEMRWGDLAAWRPVAAGVVLLMAGGVQFTIWKARRLADWRDGPRRGGPPAPDALGAWLHGLGLGARCSLVCASLMLALLAIGMMDLIAMAAVTLAIAGERLAPASLRIERVAGVAIVAAGVLTVARGASRLVAG
jgi:predicted metal-binding membrane protein